MDWGFAALLVVVLVAGFGLTFMQQRVYKDAVRRLAAEHESAKGSFLVSGQARGWLRGTIVLLVVDDASGRVTAAEAMAGATVLARFRPRPELLGLVDGIADRAGDASMRKAVEAATQQLAVMRSRASRAGVPRGRMTGRAEHA